MYFQYGDYKHPDNTVDLTTITAQRMYSPRNRIIFTRWTLSVQGHFCVEGQADIKDQLDEFEAAYEDDWKDAGLYHDNGAVSSHFLDNSRSINGVRVAAIQYPSREAEYASGRSFAITFQADYFTTRVNHSGPEDTIYSFEESVQMHGSGGPRWALQENYAGPPVPVMLNEYTVQQVVQQGRVVSLHTAWPAVPSPLLSANFEHMDQRVIARESCQKIGRHMNMLFPLRYRYVFSSVYSHFPTLMPRQDYPGR